MRASLALLILVQLLLRGVAVPHSHAHDDRATRDDHDSRPHIHLHGYAHAPRFEQAICEHPYRVELPNGRGRAPLSLVLMAVPPLEDHDQDAIYVGVEILINSAGRTPLDSLSFSDGAMPTAEPLSQGGAPWRIVTRSIGPPDGDFLTFRDLLPHLLRI